MLNSDYQKRLEKWRNEQVVEEVALDKIDIVYKVHKDANIINPRGKLSKKNLGEKPRIVVMKKNNGRYTLLFGMSDLGVLKLLNYKKTNIIVTNLNRNEVKKELEKY